MSERPSLTIDASFLAVPTIGCDSQEVHQYVSSLAQWRAFIEFGWLDSNVGEGAAAALAEENLYPLRPQLQSLFKEHGVTEYDANTIAKITDSLLTKTPTFEDFYGISEVLVENIIFEPDMADVIARSTLRMHFEDCATVIALLRQHTAELVVGHSFVLRNAPSGK